MAVAKDETAPRWRNFAVWGALGAVGYSLAVWAGTWLLTQKDIVDAMLRSRQAALMLGLGLLVAMAVAGFSSRKRPVSLRTLRNFAIRDLVAISAVLLVLWGFSALGRAGLLGGMGVSEWAALVTGTVLIVMACMASLAVASVHSGADLVDDEVVADEMRERGRLILCSLVWMVVCGLLLILLGLAGPGGALSPTVALAGALILIAILVLLGIVLWRLMDELDRTLSCEGGNLAFYLVLLLGGGWAMLAHLDYARAPSPIDWLTMFFAFTLAASFIATGRRGMLKPR